MKSIHKIENDSIQLICSGQVITDLSTSVKEIVENALDADASIIEITLKDMGMTSIQVSDNGCGIEPSNYEFLALKHFTSKINDFCDLKQLSSFGFRGEALNALCELSGNLSIITKRHSDELAQQLTYGRNGHLISQVPVSGMAKSSGTTVTVENLFSLLPVRRIEFERYICIFLYPYLS